MKIYFTSLLLLVILSLNSCYNTYEVSIAKNGSAHIEIYDWKIVGEDKISESAAGKEWYEGYDFFSKSPIISNYKRELIDNFYSVSYDIDNVDSLENYLLPFDEKTNEVAKFKYTKDEFTITKTYPKGYSSPSEATMYGDLVEFKRRIKSFKSDLDYVTQTSKKTIEINTTLNEISYGKGTYKVKVTF